MTKNFKVGDKVKTINPELKNKLKNNQYTIKYFLDNNKRCYLSSTNDKGWMIEEILYLELL